MENNDTSTHQIALSQDEVDKLLKNAAPQPVKKSLPKETEDKIKALKAKTQAVAKKMAAKEKKAASKKPATKKTTAAKKTTAVKKTSAAKKTPAKKTAAVKKAPAKKPVNKLTVYFEGKAYGTGTVVTKNGKKIIELLSIKKKK